MTLLENGFNERSEGKRHGGLYSKGVANVCGGAEARLIDRDGDGYCLILKEAWEESCMNDEGP